MKSIFTTRLLRLLWLAALFLWIAVWLYPLSSAKTRTAGVALVAVVWIGFIALGWRYRPFRFTVLGFTAICSIFLALPARSHPDINQLRLAYVEGLNRYKGVRYYWGGESPKGIDCSGLIRRGLIDAFFLQGLRTFDAGLVRHAIWVWWHDCTAHEFGEGRGFTTILFPAQNLNELDHSKILPGDLAVTRTGVHIMAFVGDHLWIEADPDLGRVVSVTAPSNDNAWFHEPMMIVRWNIFQP